MYMHIKHESLKVLHDSNLMSKNSVKNQSLSKSDIIMPNIYIPSRPKRHMLGKKNFHIIVKIFPSLLCAVQIALRTEKSSY